MASVPMLNTPTTGTVLYTEVMPLTVQSIMASVPEFLTPYTTSSNPVLPKILSLAMSRTTTRVRVSVPLLSTPAPSPPAKVSPDRDAVIPPLTRTNGRFLKKLAGAVSVNLSAPGPTTSRLAKAAAARVSVPVVRVIVRGVVPKTAGSNRIVLWP